MATSSGAAFMGASLLIAVWAVLLHSSMGQPPSPAPAASSQLDCGNCTSKCTTTSQGVFDYEASLCNTTFAPGVVYEGCLEHCANSTCNGHSYAKHGGCTIGTCTPDHCGNPCVQRCCESCTGMAHSAYDNCMASTASKAWQECMPGCMHNCRAYYGCAING